MTTEPVKFAALVLAGGRSSRMGTNKALLQVHPDSPTLIQVVVEKVLQAGAQEIFIIANLRSPYEFLGHKIVEDKIKGAGPLGGILAGLLASSHEQNLVVACDMPTINSFLIRYMAELKGNYDIVLPRWSDRSGSVQLEPLHAIYARTSLPKLEACLAAGVYALQACLPCLDVRYVEGEELVPFGNAEGIFRNLNYPEDWTAFSND